MLALAHRTVFVQYFEVLLELCKILILAPFVQRHIEWQLTFPSSGFPRIDAFRQATQRNFSNLNIVST